MGPRTCMNTKCTADNTHEWKKGWPLRSGVFADLCYNCGSAYESFVFCSTFHLEEPGWRKCHFCNKRLHCGCRASISLLELLDFEGVGCRSCAMSSQLHLVRDGIRNGSVPLTINVADDTRTPIVENRVSGDSVVEGKLMPLCRIMEASEPNLLDPSQRGDTNVSHGKDKWEEIMLPFAEAGTGFSSATQLSSGSSKFTKPDISRSMLDIEDLQESLSQPSLRMSLEMPAESSNFVLPFPNGAAGGREPCKAPPPFQQGQRSRPILPKPPKTGLTKSSETNRNTASQLRIARQPAEGRDKNHLLPRYWPRMTDQELQQLSGDLNSTIVPLFEKVLSASDAGRIGRLVVPKACAEAYFPPISQSEGFPLRVQDVKGKEWVFQFRFWPNNNSRMYVLEGVTPCIQSMQLRAGDIITFSRIDPGGKLVVGFRKASNSGDTQDAQTSTVTNGTLGGSSLSGVTENLPTVSRRSGLFQTLKGTKDPHINALSEHLILAEGGIGRHKSENNGWKKNEDSPQKSGPSMQKKRTRNIGSKSKRLLMHSEEALELRLTWEEAQDLLRPPPTANPSIVTIEDHEFEEYDEPPVFGKRTVFTTRLSGEQEQWAQCDDCSKWRKLHMDVLLPPKWTCLDNGSDSIRCSCSAAEEMIQKDLENLLRVGRDSSKHKIVEIHRPAQEDEPSGLDALATAAVLGDDAGDSGELSSVGATTRHPRHRPGCTCIVCIQPPSGQGKHNPTCTCNVCMTVKRRFKTLMLRKKRRHSEREAAEVAQKSHNDQKGESEINGSMKHKSVHTSPSNDEMSQRKSQAVEAETSSTEMDLDLNCHPNREEIIQPEVPRVSIITALDHAGSLTLENYMQQQNGLANLSSCIPQQDDNGDNERLVSEEGFLSYVDQESNLE